MVGNLGGDSAAAKLFVRAHQLVRRAGLDDAAVTVCAPNVARGGGSWDLLLAEWDSATAFCCSARASAIKFGDGRRIWADVKQSRQFACTVWQRCSRTSSSSALATPCTPRGA